MLAIRTQVELLLGRIDRSTGVMRKVYGKLLSNHSAKFPLGSGFLSLGLLTTST